MVVRNTRGGKIQTDDGALAAWTVDAIRVVRSRLYWTGDGAMPLPYSENWVEEEDLFRGGVGGIGIASSESASDTGSAFHRDGGNLYLPLWATEDVGSSVAMYDGASYGEEPDSEADAIGKVQESPCSSQNARGNGGVVISDLTLMAAEVSELLDSMEMRMQIQRQRRLERLRPMSRLRRDWYITAFCAPIMGYVGYRLVCNSGTIKQLWKEVVYKAGEFYMEHIFDPLYSM